MKIRSLFTLSPEIVKTLKELSQKTGLKMSTIVEQGIQLVKERSDKYESK